MAILRFGELVTRLTEGLIRSKSVLLYTAMSKII